MNKKGLLTTILSLAIIALAGITCFAVVDKASTSTINKTSTTTQSGPTGLLNLGDKWDINLKYTPDEQSMKASTVQYVYEYSFTNTSSANSLLLKKLSSSVIDNMTITYAYSATPVTNYSNLVGKPYEDTILQAGNQCYIYMIVTVTDTTEIASYKDNLEWAIGKPVSLTLTLLDGEEVTGYAIEGMEMPDVTAPAIDDYTFEGWYTDSACTIPVTFPNSFTSGQKLYAKYKDNSNLPTDWLAWDSATSSYYVTIGSSELPADLIIPSTYNDGTHGTANVTSIGDRAFSWCSVLTSITIPSSVTSIGNSAFSYCGGLTSITIPSSVTSIGNYAFASCSKLTSITFGDNSQLTSIGSNAFQSCSKLTSITIPSSVTSIGDSAFYMCSVLTSITIPSSVTKMGQYAFQSCSNLTSVTFEGLDGYAWYQTSSSSYTGGTKITEDLSNTSTAATCLTLTYYSKYWYKKELVPNLPSDWLAWDSSTSSYYVKAGTSTLEADTIIQSTYNDGTHGTANVTYIASGTSSYTSVFYTQRSTLKSVILPDTLTSIGNYAFYYCNGLTSITIPSSVTSIGNYAFASCSKLTSITIPSSVTSIGDNAFSWCSGLTSIVVESGNRVYDSRDNCNAIIETSTNTLTYGCKATIIPNTVTSIGEEAFYNCSGLTSITIPSSVTSIGNYAFYNCNGLTSITIPSSVTSIGTYAFYSCSVLTSITIPSSVTRIGRYAFDSCSKLTSVTFEGLDGYAWHQTLSSSYTNGIKITEDLSDPEVAATCLTSTYRTKYWYKEAN